jgi:uncharacterized repeat protein (TIGR02543 family)
LSGNQVHQYTNDDLGKVSDHNGIFKIELDISNITGSYYLGMYAIAQTYPVSVYRVEMTQDLCESNKYIVKFNGNGATSGSMSKQSFTIGTAQALTTNAYKRAYTVTYNYNESGSSNTTATATATFNGWATSASGSKVYNNKQSVTNLTTTVCGTYNLYANWTLGSITLPTPTRTGYTFKEWNTSSDGSGTSYAAGAKYTPTKDTTLYAQWK